MERDSWPIASAELMASRVKLINSPTVNAAASCAPSPRKKELAPASLSIPPTAPVKNRCMAATASLVCALTTMEMGWPIAVCWLELFSLQICGACLHGKLEGFGWQRRHNLKHFLVL